MSHNSQIELDENAKAELDQMLRQIYDQLPDAPSVVITYFEPDRMKSGGSYLDKVGKVKKIDPIERSVKFTDETVIPIECITGIALSETE